MAKFLFLTVFFAVIAASFATLPPDHYCTACKDPNEEYILAKYGEATCGEPTPKPCNPVKECRCKNGFVRHEGKCIKPCDCPPRCNPFEEFVTATKHEPTCDNLNPASCASVKECRCIAGYVRHNKKCIRVQDCPVRCTNPNEEFVLVKTTEPSCKNPVASPCNPVEECRCKNGFLRHNGKCIKPEECPCGKNEIFSLVAPVEEESCANLGKPRKPGTRPGCTCINGYVRNCYEQCVKPCDCSKH